MSLHSGHQQTQLWPASLVRDDGPNRRGWCWIPPVSEKTSAAWHRAAVGEVWRKEKVVWARIRLDVGPDLPNWAHGPDRLGRSHAAAAAARCSGSRRIIKWAAFGPFEHTGAASVPEMRHFSSDGRPARTLVQVDHAVRCRRRTCNASSTQHSSPRPPPSSLLPPASSLDLVPRSQVASHLARFLKRPLSGAPCRRCDTIAPAPRPPPTASSLTGLEPLWYPIKALIHISCGYIPRCARRNHQSCIPSFVEAEQTSRRAGMISSESISC